MLSLLHEPEEPNNICKYLLKEACIFSIRSSNMLCSGIAKKKKNEAASVYKQDSANTEDVASSYAPH